MPSKPRSPAASPPRPRRKTKTTPARPPAEPVGPAKPAASSSTGSLVLLFALTIGGGLAGWHHFGRQVENDATIAVRNYARLCDSEIVAALRARNDGKLTGEQAIEVIQQARPAIHRAAWSRIADRLTALQSDEGTFEKAKLDHFLDEMHSGLSSF